MGCERATAASERLAAVDDQEIASGGSTGRSASAPEWAMIRAAPEIWMKKGIVTNAKPDASEMTGTIGAADLPPVWLDFVLCMAWLPLWTFPGLVQASDELPFTQFFSYTLLMVLVICAPPPLAALSDRPL